MPEIKSTLDLVMERVKKFTYTHEEWKAHEIEGIKKKVRGILHRYEEQRLKLERVKTELEQLQDADEYKEIVVEAILDRIRVDRPNPHVFTLIGYVYQLSCVPFEAIQKDYQQALKKALIKRGKAMLQELASRTGISGSAVIPNMEIDQEFQQEWSALKQSYTETLSIKKEELIRAILS